MAKIALVNVPYFSHVEALLRLARVLARQNHELVVWAPMRSRQTVEELPGTFQLHEPEMPRLGGPDFMADLAAATERHAEALIDQLFGHDVDLLIHDRQAPWARVAGGYLGVPRIVSHPVFPTPGPDRFRSDAERRLAAAEAGQAAERFKGHWLSIIRRWGVPMEAIDESDSDPRIVYTTPRIVGAIELSPGWRCVGPLMTPAPPTLPRSERPLIYACFGTAYNTRPELFNAVAAALAEQPVDVLISTGNGILSTAELDPMPANVTLRPFVPARQVLARASVHITHGGCNSVHESLLAGVPMVFTPQAYDQFPLAQSIELLGAGVITDEHPHDIRDAVDLLLHSQKAHNRTQELAQHLAHYNGEDAVAELIETALTEAAPRPI